MIEYVGMSKPKKYVNKVGMCNSRNKIKQTNSISYICIVFCSLMTCTYVGLYGIGLFNFIPAVTHPDLVHILFGF